VLRYTARSERSAAAGSVFASRPSVKQLAADSREPAGLSNSGTAPIVTAADLPSL
jgi:hypothetical protein